jgi:hypothetical protein
MSGGVGLFEDDLVAGVDGCRLPGPIIKRFSAINSLSNLSSSPRLPRNKGLKLSRPHEDFT